MKISLLIATADRPDELAATLRGLADCRLPEGDLEVIVADNGEDRGTERVCRESEGSLPVRRLAVSGRGKSIALNQAVSVAAGDLLVFTDDDVEFDENWLLELCMASEEYPDHLMFGGRVIPRWPGAIPARLDGSRYLGPLYTRLDRGEERGPLERFRPFGPNMAVRRSAFERGVRFDPDLGPGAASGVTMGDETDVARQLEAMGERAVYVPESRVYHRVRPRQLSLGWQLARGVRYGRLLGRLEGPRRGSRILGRSARWYRDVVSGLGGAAWNAVLGRRRRSFDSLMSVAAAVGREQVSDPHG